MGPWRPAMTRRRSSNSWPDRRRTLRDDQWTAIEALVVQRRRALVVQRTGWGKSAVYFIAAKLLRAAGHGRDGDRVAAAGADAQPGGRRRAGRSPRRHHQLEQCRRLGRDPRTRAPRRSRRPAGQPGTVEQPRLSRSGAARAGARRRPGGGRRGALRVGLGPRLPARLPPHPHADRRTGRRRPGAGHHGDRQRPGGRRRGDAAGRRGTATPWCCAAGWTASRCGCRW